MSRGWKTLFEHIGWTIAVILCVLVYTPLEAMAQDGWLDPSTNWFTGIQLDERFLPDYQLVDQALQVKYPDFYQRKDSDLSALTFKHSGLEIDIRQLNSYESSETSSMLILGYMEVYNPTDQPTTFDRQMITVSGQLDGPNFYDNHALYPLLNGYILDVLNRNRNTIQPGETIEGYSIWRLPSSQAQQARSNQLVYFKTKSRADLTSQPNIQTYPLTDLKQEELASNASLLNDSLSGIYLGEKIPIEYLRLNINRKTGPIQWQVRDLDHYAIQLSQPNLNLEENRTYYILSINCLATNEALYGINLQIDQNQLDYADRSIHPFKFQDLIQTDNSSSHHPVKEYIAPGQTIQWTETYLLPEPVDREVLYQLAQHKHGIMTYTPLGNENTSGVHYLNLYLPFSDS